MFSSASYNQAGQVILNVNQCSDARTIRARSLYISSVAQGCWKYYLTDLANAHLKDLTTSIQMVFVLLFSPFRAAYGWDEG